MDNDPPDCTKLFFEYFLEDLGLNLFQIGLIGLKLEDAKKVYNDNKSTITLKQISDELYNCIKPFLNNSAIVTGEEISSLMIYFSILTAIIVIIVVFIIGTLKYNNKNVIIPLVIGFGLSYIIIGWLLVQNTFNIISNSIVDTENKIINCVNQAVTSVETFIQQEETAIDKALCAYT